MSQNNQFVFGLHAVLSLLQNQPGRVLRLCVQKERKDQKIEALIQEAKSAGIPVEQMPRYELDSLTNEANHQGVLVYCKKAQALSEDDLEELLENQKQPLFILVLDGVQDPHNLGACFRTADAAGVHLIIAPKDKATGITPVVAKVASGATETVPFLQVTNLARTLAKLKELGVWIYGAAGEATQSIYSAKMTGPIAIVMGAEGEGLRRLTRDHCDFLVKIPMAGSVSSLNVSVATGVVLFEVLRQRAKR